jgi:hypothetical protein
MIISDIQAAVTGSLNPEESSINGIIREIN